MQKILGEVVKNMARIPEAEIERLKEAVPVVRLVEASGVELKKGGKDLLGRCPFHEDATDSLVVTPAKNLWHCFGCGVGGGPIDWVMKRQGVSFRHAVELLKADAGLAELGAPTPRTRAKLPAISLSAPGVAAQVTTMSYDNRGLLSRVTHPDASFAEFTHDPAHRLTQISDNLGNRVVYTLDAAGNRTSEQVQDPSGNLRRQVSRVFSNLSRMQSVTGGLAMSRRVAGTRAVATCSNQQPP